MAKRGKNSNQLLKARSLMDNGKWQKWEREVLSQYSKPVLEKAMKRPNKQHRTSQNVQGLSGPVNFRKQTQRWEWKREDWLKAYLRTCYSSSSFSTTPKAACLFSGGQTAGLRTELPGTAEDGGTPSASFCCVAATPRLRGLKEPLILQKSSQGLFTWQQNGLSSKRAKPQSKSTHCSSHWWPAIWSHPIGKTSHTIRPRVKEILQNVAGTSSPSTRGTTLKTGLMSQIMTGVF